MKKILVGFFVGLIAATGIGYAITVNPASAVTADSANTPLTIPYRDASGGFSATFNTIQFPLKTIAQLAVRTDPAGTAFYMTDYGPGYAICASTAAAIHSYVYLSTSVASKVGTECL